MLNTITSNILKKLPPSLLMSHLTRNYAKKDTAAVSMIGGALKKKKMGKGGPVLEKKLLPVETDPERLVSYLCGSNIYRDPKADDVKLLPDSEYPQWLWEIRLGPPPPLEEMDPNSKLYWRRVRKMALRRNNKLSKLKKF